MPQAATPVNAQSTALGVMIRKVIVEQVVPERGVALVKDGQQFTGEIPYRVQQGRARIPRVGDYWYVDRSMGPWTFSAYIAKNDTDITTVDDDSTFGGDVVIGGGMNVAGVTTVHGFNAGPTFIDGGTFINGGLTAQGTLINGDLNVTGNVNVSGAYLRPRFGVTSTTAITPLASAANTDATITSVSATFLDGYAYRIFYSFRTQHNGGTGPYVSYAKIRRLNASGSLIYDPGGVACITTNFMANTGWCDVKNTSGNDHTQTIVLVGGFSTSGGATSIDVQAGANSPSNLRIEMLGTAAQYGGAIEVPTT